MSKTLKKTKAEVQDELQLDTQPSDEFMQLLAEVGDDDVVTGPALGERAWTYTPDEIEETVINGTVGALLAEARSESDRSLAEVGAKVGVTRARIQQIERSDNIEIATLVRFAAACGYVVGISLRPVGEGRRSLTALLGGTNA